MNYDSSMSTQEQITSAVKGWMIGGHHSVATVAPTLGISRTALYSKLSGARRWSVDDIDVLTNLGVIALAAPENDSAVTTAR